MPRRRLLGTGLALLLVFMVFPAGIAPASDEDSGNLRSVVVHPDLVRQLEQDPTGGVAAVVTTWNRDELDTIRDIVGGTKLRVLPMVLTKTLTLAQLEKLQGSPSVRSVYPNRRYKVAMEDSTWITKARYVWASSSEGGPQAFGITGKGVELAVIDTGIDGLHEDADNLIEFCETQDAVGGESPEVRCSPWPNGFNTLPAGTGTDPRADSSDDEGHGTHVSGTVAGTGHASGGTVDTHSTIGMSPHAKLRVYSANVGPALLDHEIMAAYDDMTLKKEEGYSNVVAVNNSWGGGDGSNYDSSDPLSVAVKRAHRAGILSVFAAGNSGPEHNTLSSQCVIPYTVCVAASTKPDSTVMFSSRGRPSQPTDTNRDGVIDGGDVQPDNHDWRLGQSLEKGRYRPTIAAPGVNINSLSANSPGCREDDFIIPESELPKAGCYEQLNGTSMATPHVTGAIGLIVQAYRQEHRGKTPRPNDIIDILERSANVSKLPAWEADEQGAGRLDVHEAVRYAKGITKLKPPNLGHPTPPYVPNGYPKGAVGPSDFKGCTTPLSWTFGDIETPAPGVPPVTTYGQHFIDVEPKTERLRITIQWDDLGTNNYARLWRPGVDPSADANPAGPTRTFPDQEALGLLDAPIFERFVEVRTPEAGTWTLRVYNRVPGVTDGCGATQETPPIPAPLRPTSYEYDVWVETPQVTHQPSVIIDSPAADADTTGRFVEIKGRAGYPPHAQDPPPVGNTGHSWEGITQWEVPGTAGSQSAEHEDPNPDVPRPVLYMHGNAEEGCTGQGEEDVIACSGPFLLDEPTLSPSAAAFWRTGLDDEVFDGTADRNIHDPNWVWCLVPDSPDFDCTFPEPDSPTNPTTIGGPMTVEWWATCEALCNLGADWIIRVWADGQLKFEQRVRETPTTVPPIPDRLRTTVILPTFTANRRVVVHIDPVFIDTQAVTFIYYDSEQPCPLGPAGTRCDSLVRMPAGESGASPGGPAPDNVRVTDLPADAPYPAAPRSPALRVAWDPVEGVGRYEVYRSTNALSLGQRVFRGEGTACTSPEAPGVEPDDAPPGHDRAGLCFTDTRGLSFLTTYYYRVIAVRPDGKKSMPSEIAYGAPTRYDRQVKLKVDRLYGPQHWEYAVLSPSPTPPDTTNAGLQWRFLWDTLELLAGDHDIFARSFTQGIGSQNAERTLGDDGNGGEPDPDPGCPDDDDGDGDDDEDDGDEDDDGDDDDDDCEDDDDDEEEDDD